ncbi:MAG: ferredoxin [Candidatus Berkelbacteria bacterium]|nr:ferredoxin [Candidatus Berkelbacteria bacterium]
MAESKEKVLKVDETTCIGCGACVGIADEYFELGGDQVSKVIKQYDEKDADLIEEAIKNCPVEAISLE